MLNDNSREEQQSQSKPEMATQTVTSNSIANRRQLSRIRQVRFDRSAFDRQQQCTPMRQGQVVDCIIVYPRRLRVPLCCSVTTNHIQSTISRASTFAFFALFRGQFCIGAQLPRENTKVAKSWCCSTPDRLIEDRLRADKPMKKSEQNNAPKSSIGRPDLVEITTRT